MIGRQLVIGIVVSAGLIAQSCWPATAQPAPAPAPAAAPAPPPAPPTPIAFEDAVLKAANDLFSKARLPADAPPKIMLVIDPLIDGNTGAQSKATQAMGKRITQLVAESYQKFEVQPLSTTAISQSPVVLIGTFTPINNATNKSEGVRDAYRVCLALADLKSKKIISKGVARVKPDTFDATPTAYFNDTPAFSKDDAVDGYIKSCQGTQPGDPINALYADRIIVAALINDAFNAYETKHYRESFDLYRSALRTPGGEQLRVLNGIYLTAWKLGRREQAADAFGKIIDYGLNNERLAVKFLFRPGSTQFVADRRTNAPYTMWIKQIADRSAAKNACLEVVGHTSPTGPAAINERISQLRADYVKDRLEDFKADLAKRMVSHGVGSRQNLIGTGKDDTSDALDRRVEFKIIDCGAKQASLQ